jgi:D-alanyl-D-alanine carboxypeptidase
MGGQTARKRDALMMGLLDQSFKKIPTVSNVTTTKQADTSMNNVSDDSIDQQLSTSGSQQVSTPTTAKPASFTQPKSRFALNQR